MIFRWSLQIDSDIWGYRCKKQLLIKQKTTQELCSHVYIWIDHIFVPQSFSVLISVLMSSVYGIPSKHHLCSNSASLMWNPIFTILNWPVAKSKGNVQHSLCMVCYSDQNVLLMRRWIDQMDSDIVSDVHPDLRKCWNKILKFQKTSLQGQRASASNKLWVSLDRGEGFLSFISLGFHNSALMTLLSSLEARFCLTDWIRLNMIDSSKVREVSTEALGTFSVSDQLNRVLCKKKKSLRHCTFLLRWFCFRLWFYFRIIGAII